MAELNSKQQEKLDELMDVVERYYEKGLHQKVLENLIKAWDMLPKPKEIYSESFSIAEYMANVYLEVAQMKEALEWALKTYKCDPERVDSGESEYLHGKVLFAMNKKDEAKKLFRIAMKKSEGIFPRKEDKEYISLLSK
jgi:tetratricopeptide (TPR) repeat protein